VPCLQWLSVLEHKQCLLLDLLLVLLLLHLLILQKLRVQPLQMVLPLYQWELLMLLGLDH
jgi:hypothetical protein